MDEALESVDSLTIFTLLVRCPLDGLLNSACPFAKHRDKLTIEEKFHLAEALPEDKRREMLAIHNDCLAAGYAMGATNNN